MNLLQHAASAAPSAAPEDIRDIRAPFVFPAWWHWPLAIAVAALLSLAIVLLFRWWQKRREALRSPLERARKALMVAETHARAGHSHAWADIVSETLRGALARRLGVDVLPLTTSELAQEEWARVELAAQSQTLEKNCVIRVVPYLVDTPALIALLTTCDLARFALAIVGADVLLAETAVARDLVEKLFAPAPQPIAPTLVKAPVTT